jgi:SAM-dependent MidA family methyltransferase
LQPWYSYAVARWILTDFRRAAALSPTTAPKLRIVEAGGGAGTHARHILDYLRVQAPDVYSVASYTDVELSAAMGQRAVETVENSGHRNFAVVAGDVTDTSFRWATAAGVGGEELCYIVLMEVLDNLPHDKVKFSRPTRIRDSDAFVAHQVVVGVDEQTGSLVEIAEPLTDRLLCRALEIDRAHQQREAKDTAEQVVQHPDYTPGRASGEGVLGSLLVRCSSSRDFVATLCCLFHIVIIDTWV